MFTIYHLFGTLAISFRIIIKIYSHFFIFVIPTYASGYFIFYLGVLPPARVILAFAGFPKVLSFAAER
ncbi:hypothetical protein HMPREF0868_0058 [Mageeibacillus indolicus UPII9-5]|uniref:Uncharacterized protein n=1 Tax=Mageeibacillus indolicus (strain UPII9-5) TaxID=699246 RepID=D3QZQ7_MAGIU|nr:hypothetical protein HMPREF0868_0058 [Mageeibacillus indolicus UPII9-5]